MTDGYWADKSADPLNRSLTRGSIDLMLHIVTREEWRAEIPEGRHLPRHPFKLFIEHYTYTEPCNTYDECIKTVYDMQKEHMQQGLRDIKYNFLIGGDGLVYEGRGWHVCPSKSLLKLPHLFRRRIDIAYIGDFRDKTIPEHMFRRKFDIYDFGVKYGMIKQHCNSLFATFDEDFPPPENTSDSVGAVPQLKSETISAKENGNSVNVNPGCTDNDITIQDQVSVDYSKVGSERNDDTLKSKLYRLQW